MHVRKAVADYFKETKQVLIRVVEWDDLKEEERAEDCKIEMDR